jgi:long-chain acyl-CoA synthetase
MTKAPVARVRLGRVPFGRVLALALARATLGDVWDRLAKAYGARVALTLEEPLPSDGRRLQELSYVEIADAVARMAGLLASRGVRRGDRVAVCAANRIDYALACFAAVRAGAVAVPLHHHSKPAEVEALVARSRARFLVADPDKAITRAGIVTVAMSDLLSGGVRSRPVKLAPSDPAMILFTSGTTGAPKGATLSSRALLAVARLATLIPDARNESGVCGLPLAHVMGMSTLLCALLAGARVHWISKFDAQVVLEEIEARRASFFVGVPAMYALLAEQEPERFDLSSVRLFASGADAMPPALLERFRGLGCAVRSPRGRPLLTAAFAEVYGMVELSGPAILKITPPGPRAGGPVTAPVRAALQRSKIAPRLVSARSRVQRRVRSWAGAPDDGQLALGMPIPPYRARIVDDDGRPVRPGVVGELVLRGPGVTSGYDADPSATARTTQDGWLRTGDLAWKNRLGLIAFATRKKDVVKHGGYSVFPAEVEAQLGAHPQIAEAIVFGVPHRTKGAVPAAAIVLKRGARLTERDLLTWAREHIAPFKAPRAIAIVTRDEVPRNANRKVLKDELREGLIKAGALKAL